MKVLIIEDEIVAAERLEKQLLVIDPGIEVLAKLGSVRESVKWFMNNSADLVFLDIQLSDGLSFSIFEQVNVTTPVIFTTAYDQFAIRAFQVNSISYLLKPVRHNDLAEGIRKFHAFRSSFIVDFESLLPMVLGSGTSYRKRFMVQIGEKIRKIEVDEVAYIYAREKGTYLRLFQGASYPVEYSLDNIETMVDPSKFYRINRKYIVNMNAISRMVSYSRGRIKIELDPKAEDGNDTIVSIDRSGGFRKWLDS